MSSRISRSSTLAAFWELTRVFAPSKISFRMPTRLRSNLSTRSSACFQRSSLRFQLSSLRFPAFFVALPTFLVLLPENFCLGLLVEDECNGLLDVHLPFIVAQVATS